jgi:hypothetical protein
MQSTFVLNHENVMFATLAKTRLKTEGTKSPELVAVRHTTVEVSQLLSYPKLGYEH